MYWPSGQSRNFDVFSTPNKNRWNIDVESTSKFQRLSKFQRFLDDRRNILTFFNARGRFNVESTSKPGRRNFHVEFSTLFDVFSTPNKKPLKYRRRINVEISTTVEISTFFRRPSKYSYVFQRFFDVEISTCRFKVESTSKMPAGFPMISPKLDRVCVWNFTHDIVF